MTSAQYLSNLSQEKANEVREKFKNPAFYDVKVGLIGDQEKSVMSKGLTDSDLENLKTQIVLISKMDSFTAYVREAMKDKEVTLQEIVDMSLEDWIKFTSHEEFPKFLSYEEWLEESGLEEPEVTIERPTEPSPEITGIKKLIRKLPLKEYQEYLDLDTKAAVLGKLCHSDKAPLVIARRDYLEILSKPLRKEGNGRDTCIYESIPSVTGEALESVFEGLQADYREAEKKLNKIRFDLREEETQRFRRDSADFKKAFEEYSKQAEEVEAEKQDLRKKYSAYRKEVGRKQTTMKAEFEEWKVAEHSRVSKLKIIIPEALQETYEYLENLGKTKKES